MISTPLDHRGPARWVHRAPCGPTIENTVGWSSAYDVGPGETMDVRTRLLVWHTELVLRRENHRRRAVLRQELAAYTRADLLDLEAAIQRHPLGQTQELRSMLAAQDLREAWFHPPRAA